jgi:hypothetical protein
MKQRITKVDVWAASIKDRPGGLAEKLAALSKAGANLEFVIARREASKPGTGVVFVTPVKGAKQIKAAKQVGFKTTNTLHSVRVERPDKKGLGAKMTQALAAAGINLRGLSAASIKKQCIVHFAFDGAAVAKKAMQVLKKLP